VQARQPALTLLHEIGHCLDHLGLGQAAAFASEADPLLDGWRAAITSSPAFGDLVRLSRVTTEPGLIDALRYLMTWPEFWARSYAQYVVSRDTGVQLTAELDARRQRAPWRVYIPRQWEDHEFSPIASAIDDLFGGMGWIQ
jgi:hypothetical protein